MKLKHLTLRGFKSFADRTRLDFSTGVNVVVGPNGSGKSNILDAIAWVMGTQGTKSLRTEKMEDVVFAGTATRPALPRADVTLTFANDDQTMPLDLAEITITRRLYRDGTSEYELNGVPCRLLDIQDLLSDGGIGRHQHVLVSQGEVGDVLNASPDEHRAVIEEAAGVTKHRGRRDRALRRLERTDVDVERLNDILSEKRKMMRPLKRQANAAERHDSVKDEAQALRLWFGGEELRGITGRQKSAGDERESAHTHRAESDSELEQLRGSLTSMRANAGTVGQNLERDTAAAARLETTRERLRRISVVARERSQAIFARREGADERREDLETESVQLKKDIATAATEEAGAKHQSEIKETALGALDEEERTLAEQIQLPVESVVATLRGDLRALETADKRDGAEHAQTAARVAAVDERITHDRAEISRVGDTIKSTDVEVTGLHDQYLIRTEERIAKETSWSETDAELSEQRITTVAARARAEALEAAVDGMADPDTIALAQQSDGIVGSVVARLDVPTDMAAAVDAALGDWSNSYLATDGESLVGAVDSIKRSGSGGVSFVVTNEHSIEQATETARTYGVDRLVDLLGPDADRRLADSIIGDVVLVQGWKSGWEITRAHLDVRIVTPEGDVITSSGMHVAQPDGAGPAALEAANVSLEIAERDLSALESRVVPLRREFDVLLNAERQVLEQLEAAEARLAGLTEALGLSDRSLAASTAEHDRLAQRVEALTGASSDRTERIEMLRDRVADFEGEEAVRQSAWDALNKRREEVAVRRDDARKASSQVAAAYASLVERRSMMESRLETVVAEMSQLVLVPHVDGSIERLAHIQERAEDAITAVSSHVATLRDRQRDMRSELGEANKTLGGAEDRREELEKSTRALSDSLGSLDVELAELAVRHEAVVEGLARDSDATESEALSALEPEPKPGVDPRARLATLEADLRRMGPINPLAASEYAQLAEGSNELDHQLGDLNESRSELRKIISALDEKMGTLFSEAFEEISTFFAENFSLVFPGGTGRLKLTDPDNPLTTGVEVEAQPAGKKVGRLSLLSGGERSLAALAFLFAVFRSRPSPFYVLDEVEAALDDANLRRFLRLVDTLRDSVQLVIITHQQHTMEAADVLYGVTMEPGESSVVITKKMTGTRVSAPSSAVS